MKITQDPSYDLYPIGQIVASQGNYSVQISDNYRDALMGLKEFSHALVFWWASRCDKDIYRQQTILKKPYTSSEENVGVFATRSPVRPNPIAMTVVNLSSIDEKSGTISLPFIDAEDGSPVVDIKPYFPSSDRVETCYTPKYFGHWPQMLEDSAAFDWSKEFREGVE